MITLKIDKIDRSRQVEMGSLRKTDNLNQRIDTCAFTMINYAKYPFKPEVGSEMEIFDDALLIFAGVIIKVESGRDHNNVLTYQVECKDWTQYLDRYLVAESYQNVTIESIIKDIYYKYVVDWAAGAVAVSLPNTDDVYSYEVPAVGSAPGGFLLRPNGFTWGFSGRSGLAKNGSVYGQANAPHGQQVALLQDDAGTGDGPGYIFKYFNPLQAGKYVIAFKAAKRPGYATATFDLKINGIVKQSFSIAHDDFRQYFSDPIQLNTGFSELGFAVTGTNMTAFIDDLRFSTKDAFNVNGVVCPLNAVTLTLNRISVTAALEKMSKMTSYVWYVDYDKTINFFEKNSKHAPFDLTDTSENYMYDSLSLTDDISQLRNRVYIRGGEAEGATRIETQNGDNIKKHFVTANKFSKQPLVRVNGVLVNTGLDYVSDEASYDAFWSFQEKYVRFKVPPAAGTNNIEFEGKPLYPVQVQVQDGVSISKYGIYEFARRDSSIKSRDEAFLFAKAELEAYAKSVIEGGFQTYNAGLRSGQIINVDSLGRDKNEDLVIQRVTTNMVSASGKLVYNVQLATLRTMSIIGVLLDLLRTEDRLINDSAPEQIEKAVFTTEDILIEDVQTINSGVQIPDEPIIINESVQVQALNFPTSWVIGPWLPISGDPRRQFILNRSPIS